MVAFLIDSPRMGKFEKEGGINMENVAEELLNGFFCHYEPPTSETAQFKAAREARADPVKYSRRPVAKPILKISHLHPKNRKNDKGGAAAPPTNSSVAPTNTSVAPTAGNSSASKSGSGKSVTWRDEQTNQDRTKVEKDVVGCAANYCGIFRQGEGLTDILMSPQEKAVADKEASSTKKSTPAAAPTAETPTSAISSQGSKDDASTGSATKKRLTPILTSRNKKNKTEAEETPTSAARSPESIASLQHRAGKRILYDDLGNPIEEGDAYASLEEEGAGENGFPLTPGGTSSVAEDTPRSMAEGGDDVADAATVDTPTAEKTGATSVDANNPLAFFWSVPTALIGSAAVAVASAAAAVGYKPTTTADETKQAEGDESPTTPQPSPSILRKPAAPTYRSTGVLAEYRDEIGVYEPEDYDDPFPHIVRDSRKSLGYRRVRTPPIRRRQPTPRRVRGYEEDMVYERRDYHSQLAMEDGNMVSSLGKIPRQSTGTYDTSAAHMSPRDLNSEPLSSRQGHDLSPSTITGASAYFYEDDALVRRARPCKSPGRRSDVYSDLTMEEEYYRYQDRGDRSRVSADYEEKAFMYLHEEQHMAARRYTSDGSRASSRGGNKAMVDTAREMLAEEEEEQLSRREHLAARRYPNDGSRASSRSGQRSRGANTAMVDTARKMLSEEEEEQLSPREYAKQYRKMRGSGNDPEVFDNNDRSLIIDDEAASEETGSGENLSPRQYAEKYRQRRSAEDSKVTDQVNALMDEEDRSEVFSNNARGSGRKKSKARKDPAPRGSIDPAEAVGGYSKQRAQLPPTPRRDPDSPQQRPKPPVANGARDNFTFSKKEPNEQLEKSREALMRQFSPRSMATDDEIREEVSSVGMASETIRPLYYENPFLEVPPPVIEGKEEEKAPIKQVQKKGSKGSEASTLSGSTLSSKPSTQVSGRSSQKKPSKSPDVQESSSGSTRSKTLWRGWKKTIGNVKKIVKDIDEQRIHPPQLSKP